MHLFSSNYKPHGNRFRIFKEIHCFTRNYSILNDPTKIYSDSDKSFNELLFDNLY